MDNCRELTEKVRRNPYSVILFDEFEKAHLDITNILLHLETDDIKFQKEILPIFFEHTKILDKLRGQSFSELAPELYNLLHKTPLLAEVK